MEIAQNQSNKSKWSQWLQTIVQSVIVLTVGGWLVTQITSLNSRVGTIEGRLENISKKVDLVPDIREQLVRIDERQRNMEIILNEVKSDLKKIAPPAVGRTSPYPTDPVGPGGRTGSGPADPVGPGGRTSPYPTDPVGPGGRTGSGPADPVGPGGKTGSGPANPAGAANSSPMAIILKFIGMGAISIFLLSLPYIIEQKAKVPRTRKSL